MNKHYVFLTLAFTGLLAACGPGADTSTLDLNTDNSSIINGTKISSRANDGGRSVVLFLPVNSLGMATGICTATLISDHSVLTAAHCYKKQSKTLTGFKIIFANNKGISTRDSLKREGTHSDVVVHPQFRETKIGLLNDLAIAFFDGGIPTGFEPVEIERDQNANYGRRLINAYGYGKNRDSSEPFAVGFGSAGDLYRAVLKVSSGYSAMADRYNILGFENTQYVCSGDSGGGQFITVNNKPRLIGVTSGVRGKQDIFGHVSCTGLQSTAMKVSYFSTWIDEVHAAAKR